MNLSSKELSALERSSLEKGLKFAIAPRKIPTAEIVAAVEESISQLNDDRRHLVRAEVSSILRRAKPPPKNIQKDVFNALIALKKDPDRLVLSADKGNCVVVTDKQQYHDKALSLLNDKSTYAVLNSDPTSKTVSKKVKQKVKFPHSPILHYTFSYWIEKTMTKTIHCRWENRFILQ